MLFIFKGFSHHHNGSSVKLNIFHMLGIVGELIKQLPSDQSLIMGLSSVFVSSGRHLTPTAARVEEFKDKKYLDKERWSQNG